MLSAVIRYSVLHLFFNDSDNDIANFIFYQSCAYCILLNTVVAWAGNNSCVFGP